MTKRDVAVWFCKVVALVGMISSGANLLGNLVGINYLGARGLMFFLPNFGLHLFVWLIAEGIGTELAAEGEHGTPIVSGAELRGLLLRCVGLWLFLSASVSLSITLFSWAYEYFTSAASFRTTYLSYLAYQLTSNFTQSIGGFCLAFAPRIRIFWTNTFRPATRTPRSPS